MKTSVIIILFALISFTSALTPLSFINGFNNGLGLQSNSIVNKCAYTFLKGEALAQSFLMADAPYDLGIECFQAAHIYFQTIMNAGIHATEVSEDPYGVNAVASTFQGLIDMKYGKHYEAGEAFAKALKDAAISVGQAVHARELAGKGKVNWNQVLVGFNDQLLITNEKEFVKCLDDSKEVQTIVKALIIAINHQDVIHSIQDVAKLIKHLPALKRNCKATVKNYGMFFAKIEKAYNKDQTAFFETISLNIERNPVKFTQALTGFFRGLKSGQDYKAGRSLGVLTQIALKGIIN